MGGNTTASLVVIHRIPLRSDKSMTSALILTNWIKQDLYGDALGKCAHEIWLSHVHQISESAEHVSEIMVEGPATKRSTELGLGVLAREVNGSGK